MPNLKKSNLIPKSFFASQFYQEKQEQAYQKFLKSQEWGKTLKTIKIKRSTTDEKIKEAHDFTKEDIQKLKPLEIKSLPTEIFVKFTKEQIQAFLPEQIKSILPSQMRSFTKEQIQALTIDQIKKITDHQIWNLKKEQIQVFTKEQIQGFTFWHITKISGNQFEYFFTLEQIKWLTLDQAIRISPRQREYLSVEKIKVLNLKIQEKINRLKESIEKEIDKKREFNKWINKIKREDKSIFSEDEEREISMPQAHKQIEDTLILRYEELVEILKREQELENQQKNINDKNEKEYSDLVKKYLFNNLERLTKLFISLNENELFTKSWSALSNDWNNYKITWYIRNSLLIEFNKIKYTSEVALEYINKYIEFSNNSNSYLVFSDFQKNKKNYLQFHDFFKKVNFRSIEILKDIDKIKILNDTKKYGITFSGSWKEFLRSINFLEIKPLEFRDEEPFGQIERVYHKNLHFIRQLSKESIKNFNLIESFMNVSEDLKSSHFEYIFNLETKKLSKEENSKIILILKEYKIFMEYIVQDKFLNNKILTEQELKTLEEYKNTKLDLLNNIFQDIKHLLKGNKILDSNLILNQNKIIFSLNNIFKVIKDINDKKRIIKNKDKFLQYFNNELFKDINNFLEDLPKLENNIYFNYWLMEIEKSRSIVNDDLFDCTTEMINFYKSVWKELKDDSVPVEKILNSFLEINSAFHNSYRWIRNIISLYNENENKDNQFDINKLKNFQSVVDAMNVENNRLRSILKQLIKEIKLKSKDSTIYDSDSSIEKFKKILFFYYKICNRMLKNNKIFSQIILKSKSEIQNHLDDPKLMDNLKDIKFIYPLENIDEIFSLFLTSNLKSMHTIILFLNKEFLNKNDLNCDNLFRVSEEMQGNYISEMNYIIKEFENILMKNKSVSVRHIPEENINSIMNTSTLTILPTEETISDYFSLTGSNQNDFLDGNNFDFPNWYWIGAIVLSSSLITVTVMAYKIYNYFLNDNTKNLVEQTSDFFIQSTHNFNSILQNTNDIPQWSEQSQLEDNIDRGEEAYCNTGQNSGSSSESDYLNLLEEQLTVIEESQVVKSDQAGNWQSEQVQQVSQSQDPTGMTEYFESM